MGDDGIYKNFFFQHEDTESINGKNELKGFVENFAINKALLSGSVNNQDVNSKKIPKPGKNELKGFVENFATNKALLTGSVNNQGANNKKRRTRHARRRG